MSKARIEPKTHIKTGAPHRKDLLAVMAAIVWTELRGRLDDGVEDRKLAISIADHLLQDTEAYLQEK